MLIAPIELDKDRFEAAKKGRGRGSLLIIISLDILIANAIKFYRYKTYDAPEVEIQRQIFKVADEQVKNRENGLDFQKSWDKMINDKNLKMKEIVKIGPSNPDEEIIEDGEKDWSLSADGFKIYVASENKESVNKDAYKEDDISEEIYPGQAYNEAEGQGEGEHPQYEAEAEMDNEEEESEGLDENLFEEPKTNNIDIKGMENLTLESFQARPDGIKKVSLIQVTDWAAKISWEVPDWNNSEITEYLIKCKEVNLQFF